MTTQEIKLECLRIAGNNIQKAQEIFEWVMGDTVTRRAENVGSPNNPLSIKLLTEINELLNNKKSTNAFKVSELARIAGRESEYPAPPIFDGVDNWKQRLDNIEKGFNTLLKLKQND